MQVLCLTSGVVAMTRQWPYTPIVWGSTPARGKLSFYFLFGRFVFVSLIFFTIIILPVGWLQFIHILNPLITASQGVAINVFLVNKERVSLPKLQCNGDGIKKAISVKFGSHYHWPIIRFTDIFWDEWGAQFIARKNIITQICLLSCDQEWKFFTFVKK